MVCTHTESVGGSEPGGGMRFPAPVLRHISNAVLAVQNQSSGFARQITPILIGSPDYHSVGEALLLRVPGQFSLLPPDPRKQINAALPWVCILELMRMLPPDLHCQKQKQHHTLGQTSWTMSE